MPADFSLVSIFFALGAGLFSVTSPCVLPVIPLLVTGTAEDHRLRPLLIVLGLSITFILMGVVTALFGSLLAGRFLYLERGVGVLIILAGVALLLGIDVFKNLPVFSCAKGRTSGPWTGLFLGATLGLVWIPCIGPFLSSILATVAAQGRLTTGIVLLLFYSLGFAIPMLLLGYSSLAIRQRVQKIREYPALVRGISGGLLILFGIFILTEGILGFAI